MSSLLQRIKTIFEAKTNKILDGLEDPNETLDLAYEKMLTGLQEVKHHLADVLTEQKRLEAKIGQSQQAMKQHKDDAMAALKLGKETLASQALELKHDEEVKVSELTRARDHIQSQVEKLKATESQFKHKIEQFRSQKEITKASYQAAKAQVKVKESLSGIGSDLGNVGQALNRAHDKNEEMQARAEAMDDLNDDVMGDALNSGSNVERELNAVRKESAVADELAALKEAIK